VSGVGVIVAAHGFSPFLGEALESVLGQEPAPAAVVLVDDGSFAPLEVPGGMAGALSLVRLAVRRGPAAARAAGQAALDPSVSLIAFCDADDAWEPGSLELRVAAMGASDAAVAFGRAHVVGPDGRATGERWSLPAAGVLRGAAWVRSLYAANPICLSSAIVRRGPLAAAGGLESPLWRGEDWDLWLRLAAAGERFVCVPGAVVRYRRHPGGLTADVAALARDRLELHRLHGALVDEATRAAALAADRAALADGLVRERRYGEARAALAEAGALRPWSPRERALAALLRVPGARRALGRRDPYRR
jgi:glycosyltransferase involved in cell wall biosynthesis